MSVVSVARHGVGYLTKPGVTLAAAQPPRPRLMLAAASPQAREKFLALYCSGGARAATVSE